MSKTDCIVSVIVPVYKVEKYLHQCIDSIREQTYSRLEIILVDDGSPDNCGSICDKYSAEDSRIIVIHKENGGLSSARNAGLDIAAGKYVAFVDADDIVHPRYIEVLAALCERYNCDIAQCDFLAVTERSLRLPANPQQFLLFYDGKQALSKLCTSKDAVKYSVAWNKIYRKELFDEIRYPYGRIHEDEFTTYLIFWKASRVVVTNQYLYYYLQRTTSIMGQKFSVKRLDALTAFKERLIFLEKNGLEKEYFYTLHVYLHLIERDYELLNEHVEGCAEICELLLQEKKRIAGIIPIMPEEKEEAPIPHLQMMRICSYLPETRILLYGAGVWGHIFYRWMIDNHHGRIVGWVDNLWYEMKNAEYPIMPLDALLRISYDYVLITIENQSVQEEVRKNLICWGIPEEKILLNSADESFRNNQWEE